MPVVREEDSKRYCSFYKWGLVPFWAKEIKIGYKMINARMETIDQKPAYKNAFLKRRCLIPADGFYEWKEIDGRKQPYRFTLPGNSLFAFPGIWETWTSPDNNVVYSCSIITTAANEYIQHIHDRMPVILSSASDHSTWLLSDNPAVLKDLLQPYKGEIIAFEVSQLVNSAKIDNPSLIEKI
ncbi:MAG: SOS response-associated peptidase [Desulfitobacterium hafniense]|nr:SOS response-associated peptidase [Desulfitobacterium hafniense]